MTEQTPSSDPAPRATGPHRATRATSRTANRAYLPIGLVFMAMAVIGFVTDMSPTAYAFLPIGITFLILGLSKDDEDEEAPAPQPGPDVTPR